MKDIKNTLKGTLGHYKTWVKILWKHYLLLAVVAAVAAFAFWQICRSTLLPLAIYCQETDDWGLIFSILGIDVLWLTIFILGLVATVVCSVLAHKAMKRVVQGFEKKELGTSRRNLLLTEGVIIMLGIIIVTFLPVAVLFASGLAASMSGLMLDNVPTPAWANIAFVLCTALAVFVCEVFMTFVRLLFREI